MKISDIIFLTLFTLSFALLLIFGILSFIFNYLKIIKLKKKINNNELQASKNLKEVINSTFWGYKLIFYPELMEESNKLVNKNKILSKLKSKHKRFEKLQLLSLLALVIIFILYISFNILKAWFTKTY